jgi:putative solute:sodium symporter small subunit
MSDNTGYWKENVSLLLKLLAIWFVVSFGMGIILADYLDQFQFFGFRLGFWMSQQGSIYVFVALIFVYVSKMNKLDKKYGVEEDEGDVPAEDLAKGDQ